MATKKPVQVVELNEGVQSLKERAKELGESCFAAATNPVTVAELLRDTAARAVLSATRERITMLLYSVNILEHQ